ncbi:unnamed protein product [Rhodiola kirilowii]
MGLTSLLSKVEEMGSRLDRSQTPAGDPNPKHEGRHKAYDADASGHDEDVCDRESIFFRPET